MWRAIALLAAALAVCAMAPATPTRAAASRAELKVTRTAPLTVRGSGFERSERVRVLARAGTRSIVRRVAADGRGAFTTTFADIKVGHCGVFSIVATGGAGSRAAVRRHLGVASCNPR
jgi:hypothetical protein